MVLPSPIVRSLIVIAITDDRVSHWILNWVLHSILSPSPSLSYTSEVVHFTLRPVQIYKMHFGPLYYRSLERDKILTLQFAKENFENKIEL